MDWLTNTDIHILHGYKNSIAPRTLGLSCACAKQTYRVMANREVIVISDDESEDESDGKDVDVTESDNDSTSLKRRA